MTDDDELAILRSLRTRKRLERFGVAMIVLPLVIGLATAAHLRDRNNMREAAVEICTVNSSPCPGDQTEIARVSGKKPGHRTRFGLVVYRRSSDCSREVEVYFTDAGNFQFRGSVDDPDVAARNEFIEARNERYGELRFGPRLPCERAGELRNLYW
jgi:hypothetical protein